ncbi:MAG TPA: ABC transporter permease [Deinococcales bacterium]|nr:ABC transporter permease [Deinococcales bacterium]
MVATVTKGVDARPAGRRLSPRWRRFFRDPITVTALVLVLGLVAVAVLAPMIAPHDPSISFPDGLSDAGAPVGPSARFPFGTDLLGRDLLSRVVYGTRVSLAIGVLANGAATVIGLTVGLLAGFFGGAVGTLLMRLTDLMMAFPVLLLAIALTAILTPSLLIVALVIALLNWVGLARVVYGMVMGLKNREFVLAAEALGARPARIVWRHVLPQLVSVTLVWGTLGISTSVMLEATLSFLGVGVQPPTPSWGGIINESQSYFTLAPWLVAFPGLAILVTALAFNLLGEGLREALDPSRRPGRVGY